MGDRRAGIPVSSTPACLLVKTKFQGVSGRRRIVRSTAFTFDRLGYAACGTKTALFLTWYGDKPRMGNRAATGVVFHPDSNSERINPPTR